jgi:hypothetical protein
MQIERWMDIYSDDEPDLMGLELVREFDILAKRFYDIFDNDDLNEWAESSEICVGIRSEIRGGYCSRQFLFRSQTEQKCKGKKGGNCTSI